MKLKVFILASCMLLTGTINTISTKFQDLAIVGHETDGRPRTFKHPAVQSLFMFFGESLCLLPFFFLEWRLRDTKTRQRRRAELESQGKAFRIRRVLAFAIPAMCDAVGTTLINVGLYYTYASTYQMLRGTLVLFAGLMTILILRRTLYLHHWLGMVLITGGAALVGAASVAHKHPAHPAPSAQASGGIASAPWSLLRALAAPLLGGGSGVDAASAPLFGDLCVVGAQAFTALQFILEEKFVAQYRVPTLLAVGLEGAWGLALCVLVLPVMALLRDASGRPIDSFVQAMAEISHNAPLALSVALSIVSIAFFNFFGISVTKALSGAARATIDACRTIFIWAVAMGLGWEHFLPLQVVGFAVLFAGTSLYNELIRSCLPHRDREEAAAEARREQRRRVCATSGSGAGEGSGNESDSERSSEGAPRGSRSRLLPDDQEAGLAEPLLASPGKPTPAAAHQLLPQAPAHGLDAAAAAAQQQQQHQLPHSANIMATGRSQAHRPRHAEYDEYTMARSMRLGATTLSPHALDDTDADTEAGLGGSSYDGPRTLSYEGSLAAPLHMNIPEGDEDEAAANANSSSSEENGERNGRGQPQRVPLLRPDASSQHR